MDLTATNCPLAGEGLTVMKLTEVEFVNNELILTFGDAGSTLEAGTSYLIKWADSGTTLEAPTFKGVTIDKAAPAASPADNDIILFKGLYNPLHLDSADDTKLFLGDGNQLYYPDGEMTIGAFRAYFQLGAGITAGQPIDSSEGIKAFILDFGDDETCISEISDCSEHSKYTDSYFTLDGFRLNGKPEIKGIYLHNGKKCVIK